MRTTPNLSLTVWDSPNDEFDPSALVNNFEIIDSAFAPESINLTPSRFIEGGATLPTSGNIAGRLYFLTAPASGFQANSLVRFDGSTWRSIGPLEVFSSVPTLGNYPGRLITLSSATGGFSAFDTIVYNGASWSKIGGTVVVNTTSAITAPFAGMLAVVTADPSFPAYSLVIYDGSNWSRTEKRSVEVLATLPSSPYSGQVVVVSAGVGGFNAWDVVRFDGSSWGKIGPATTTSPTVINYYQDLTANTIIGHNSWTDLLTQSLTAGTWLIFGSTRFSINNSSMTALLRLWDGTNVAAEAEATRGANERYSVYAQAIVTLSSTTTYKLSATSTDGGSYAAATAAGPNATTNKTTYLGAVQLA